MSTPVPPGAAVPPLDARPAAATPLTATRTASPRTKAPIPSDPEEIERRIRERQARLAATVDELTTRLSPKEIARRSKDTARQKANEAVRAEDGSLRTERVGAAGAAAVALLVVWVLRRLRRKRRRVPSSK